MFENYGNYIIYLVIGVFVLLSFIFTAHYNSIVNNKYRGLQDAIQKFNKCLDNMSNLRDLDVSTINKECYSADYFKNLKNIWEDYSKEIDSKTLHSYESATKYFSASNLLSLNLPNREFIKAYPGILTSWGLLGTFIAILISLQCLNIDPITSEVQGIEQLISGLGAKFISSVAALACAIYFIWVERHEYSKLKSECYKLATNLNQNFPITSEKKLLHSLSEKLDFQADILDKVGRNMEKTTSESCERMVGEFINKLNSATEQDFNNMHDLFIDITESFDKMQEVQVKIQETQLEINQESEKSLKTQKNTISKIEKIIDTTDEKISSFNTVIDEMNTMLTRISNITGEMSYAGEQYATLLPDLKLLKDTMANFNDNLQSNTQSLIDISSQLTLDKLKPMLFELKESIKNNLDEIQVCMNESVENIHIGVDYYHSFEETAEKNITKVGTTIEDFVNQFDAFQTKYDTSLTNVVNYLNTNAKALDNTMTNNINKLGTNITELNDKLEELSAALREKIDMLEELVPEDGDIDE